MYQFSEQNTAFENDQFVSNHELCNLLQSSAWANIKSNWKHLYTSMKKDGKIVATAMVLIKPLPLGFTLFYIPRGPVMDYDDQELVSAYLKELIMLGKKHRCLYIKFDPAILKNSYPIDNPSTETSLACQSALTTLTQAGAIHLGYSKDISSVIQPRYQANVYASDEFQENLPRHTKRLMKDAQKRSVAIQIHGLEAVEAFANVVSKTENRKNISLRNQEYFTKLMNTYSDDAKIVLASINLQKLLSDAQEKLSNIQDEIANTPENSVKKLHRLFEQRTSIEKELNEFSQIELTANESSDHIVIAGCLSIKYGNTMEMLYAGMDDRFKKFMPQYCIYVTQMQWAFDHGCKWCNMGGVEGSLDDGLTKFKSNFNPMIDEYIGEFDLPVNKLLYKSSQMAYKIRKSMKV